MQIGLRMKRITTNIGADQECERFRRFSGDVAVGYVCMYDEAPEYLLSHEFMSRIAKRDSLLIRTIEAHKSMNLES
jgi:hypothetical protein